MRSIPILTHTEAMDLLDVVRAELQKRDAGAAVAVTDAHGELMAFLRTDGCPLPSINNAIHKAFTAAREGIPSRKLGEASQRDPFPMTNFGDLRYTGWGGGVPLKVDGVVVGAIGISGLPEKEDMELAEMALEAFGDRLTGGSG